MWSITRRALFRTILVSCGLLPSFGWAMSCTDAFTRALPAYGLRPTSIAFVNPFFSSGSRLANYLNLPKGEGALSVITAGVPGDSNYHREQFSAEVTNYGNLDKVVEQLRTQGIEHIFQASEASLPDGEVIAAKLGIKIMNDPNPELIAARRNKIAQNRVLARSGVPVAETIEVSTLQSALEIARRFLETDALVVIKPNESAAMEGVTVCSNLEEVRIAAQSLFGTNDHFGHPINEIAVQRINDGQEYAFNMTSAILPNGRVHRWFNGVWEYGRMRETGKSPRYRYDLLLPMSEGVIQRLVPVALHAAQSLGIRVGASHFELFDTASGVIFGEGAARLSGVLPEREALATDRNPFDMAIASQLSPSTLNEIPRDYQLNHGLVGIVFLSSDSGKRLDLSQLSVLKRIPGVASIRFFEKEGAPIHPVSKGITHFGEVDVHGADRTTVMKTIEAVLKMLDSGAFES